jgi:hypothetical protein
MIGIGGSIFLLLPAQMIGRTLGEDDEDIQSKISHNMHLYAII